MLALLLWSDRTGESRYHLLYQVAVKDSSFSPPASSAPPAQEQLWLSTTFERNLVLGALW
jgi:hypothetical protein